MPRFVHSLEAFSSPVGVLDADVVNRDQREKLTVWQFGGVAGISAQGGMMDCMVLAGCGCFEEFEQCRQTLSLANAVELVL